MRIKWHCRLLRLASLPNCFCFVTAREEEEFYRARRRVTRGAGAAARRAGRKWPLTEAEVERIVFENR